MDFEGGDGWAGHDGDETVGWDYRCACSSARAIALNVVDTHDCRLYIGMEKEAKQRDRDQSKPKSARLTSRSNAQSPYMVSEHDVPTVGCQSVTREPGP